MGLTSRERQVLSAISHGCTNVEIARRLGMKEGTVKTHLQGIGNPTVSRKGREGKG